MSPVLALALAASVTAAPAAPSRIGEAELAAVLPEPARGAPAALRERRFDDALAALSGAGGAEARLLRARALFHLARHEEALAALEGLAAQLPEVADRVQFLRAKVLAALSRPGEAAAAWGAVGAGSTLAGAAAVARGEALERAGRPEEALASLLPISARPAPADPSEPDPGAAALLAVGRLRTAADPAAARRALLACWTEHVLAPEAEPCLAAIRLLPGESGAEPAAEELVGRAERLLEANRNRPAIELLGAALGRLPAPGPEAALSCRGQSALGRALRKERAWMKAVEVLGPVTSACADGALRARALFAMAAAQAAMGERMPALESYRRLAAQFPESSLADDALLSAADLLERRGRLDEARALFDQVAALGPGADRRPEALFRAAWARRRAGDAAGAIERLRAVEAEFRDSDPYEHARAAYWRARTLAARGADGDAAAAKEAWAELARRYPVDWYGLLSRARLGQAKGDGTGALPEPIPGARRAPPILEPGPLADDPRLVAALRLLRMGLGEEAAEELRAIDLGTIRGRPGGEGAVFAVAALLDRAGDHRRAHAILKTDGRAVLRGAPAGEAIRLWCIAYPEAFRAEVLRWTAPAGVPADLLQALMREESALDPNVVSTAGAVGLTQLMPQTAAEVARRHHVGPVTAASLTDPALNIRLGAALLGELLARYGGQPALALAAYNAGSGAVDKWLEARGSLELDEFVEEIPLDETRGYVKRVLRTFAAYRLLSDRAGPETLDLLPRALRRGGRAEAIPPRGSGFGLPRGSG
jgi:soluble lytic murein transglycosylase